MFRPICVQWCCCSPFEGAPPLPLLQILPNSPYVLEELVATVSEESSLVKLHLLTAAMKLFFKRPPECQEMLGRLLEYAVGQ